MSAPPGVFRLGMSTRTRSSLPATFAGLAVLFVARASFADHYHVPSGSMEPTVQIGDHVCVDKRAYGLRVPGTESYLLRWSEPARGDVVVLHSPETGDVLLKRVAALPGEQLTVRGERRTVPKDHVAVLGDNRDNSHDSRAFGFVEADAILGRVAAVCLRDGRPVWTDVAPPR